MSSEGFSGTDQYVATGDRYPEAETRGEHGHSARLTRELFSERMSPLSIAGLDLAIRELQHPLGGTGAAHAVAAATSVTQDPPPAAR